jgi:hypothetical protein
MQEISFPCSLPTATGATATPMLPVQAEVSGWRTMEM